MNLRNPAVALLGLVLLFGGPARADTLELLTGEAFTGELVSIRDGVLTFSTTLAGQMMAPSSQVARVTTSGLFEVALRGERARFARFVTRRDGIALEARDGEVLRLADGLGTVVTAVALPGEPPQSTSNRPDGTWRTALDTGVHRRMGTQDYTDLFARLALMRRTDAFGFEGDLLVERADPDAWPRWLRADAEWRLGSEASAYPVAAAELTRDTVDALALRGSLSLGIGKVLLDEGGQQLRGSAGIAGRAETWDQGLLEGDSPRTLRPLHRYRDDTRNDTELDLRLRLRYAGAWAQRGEFREDLRLYPGLTDPGELRAQSESSLLLPLTARFQLRLDVLVDYQSDPAFRRLDQWRTSVGASLRWDF